MVRFGFSLVWLSFIWFCRRNVVDKPNGEKTAGRRSSGERPAEKRSSTVFRGNVRKNSIILRTFEE